MSYTRSLTSAGVDTGPILHQEVINIAPDETATTLYEKAAKAHAAGIQEVVSKLLGGRLEERPQDESKASVWPKRRPSDGRIRPDMTVEEIDRLVRAVTHPYPGAFWEEDGKRITVWAGRVVDCDAPCRRFELADGCYEALERDVE